MLVDRDADRSPVGRAHRRERPGLGSASARQDAAARALLARALAEARGAALGVGIATAADTSAALAVDEDRLANGMTPARRDEFTLGRLAAHRAIDDAGLPQSPVMFDGRRPRFGAGAIGTISHSRGVAVALVARAERYRSVGVDLEFGRLPLRAARFVLSAAETMSLSPLNRRAAARLLLVYFTIKEAAFKALDPVLDAGAPPLRELTLSPTAGGCICGTRLAPSVKCLVRTRAVGDGVLSWTALDRIDARGGSRCPLR